MIELIIGGCIVAAFVVAMIVVIVIGLGWRGACFVIGFCVLAPSLLVTGMVLLIDGLCKLGV